MSWEIIGNTVLDEGRVWKCILFDSIKINVGFEWVDGIKRTDLVLIRRVIDKNLEIFCKMCSRIAIQVARSFIPQIVYLICQGYRTQVV